jgi:hypothetical protein
MLIEKFKRKMKMEESASGISPELTEMDVLLEEIIGRIEVATEASHGEEEIAKNKIEKDKKEAEDIRLKAMEKLGSQRKEQVRKKNQMRKQVNEEDRMVLIQ